MNELDYSTTDNDTDQLAAEARKAGQAEASLIHLMLADNGVYRSCPVSESWFTGTVWRKTYGAIRALVDQQQVADYITVSDYLDGTDPGYNWLATLAELNRNTVARAESADSYAKIIRDNHARNSAYQIARRLMESSRQGQTAIDAAISELMALDTVESSHDHDAKTIIRGAIQYTEEAFERGSNGQLVGLPTGLKDLDRATGGWHNSDLVVIPARPAMGKAQPLTSKVLLSTGEWKLMGDIQAGDQLASVDGASSKVTGVFPQGERPIYQLDLSDGRVVEADAEHLWTIESSKFAGRKTVKTTDLIEMLKRERYQNRIRLVGHTGDFGHLDDIGIDPWLLGFLLGDGCFQKSTVRFSTAEEYALQRVHDALPSSCDTNYRGKYDYSIVSKESKNPITAWLRTNGLGDKNSHEKFIPRQVFAATKSVRRGVLAGLIESDGWIQNGSLQFSSSSEKMANDVVAIVRSLGGMCRLRRKEVTKYTHNDEDRFGKPAYICSIALDGIEDLLKSPRLRKNMQTRRKSCNPIIRAVTFNRQDQAQCIMVDHPEHLYITDDYTVTHNTALLLNLAINSGVPFGIISSEQSHDQMGVRMISISGKVSGNKIRQGTLEEEDWTKLSAGAQTLMRRNFWINDDGTITIDGIRRQARKWFYTHGIKVLFVDYIQRIYPTDKRLPKHEQVAEVTTGLKSLAKELGIPVIALAQVNRECEKRTDRRPSMGDIADASIIEKEADMIMTLYRDEVYNDDTTDKGIAELGICKNRHGPIGVLRAAWQGSYFRFEDLAYNGYE